MSNNKFLFKHTPILETDVIKLELLKEEHISSLAGLINDDSLWRYFTSDLSNKNKLKNFVQKSINEYAAGTRVPFLIIDKKSQQAAGSSSFGNISFFDKRLEIGWTWLGKKFHGSGINKQAKYVMLHFAFEELNFERVEFKTDVLNLAARHALQKIGATEEGILRSHTQMPGNRRRDTIYYSILKSEWSQIKNTLFKNF